MKHTKRLDSLVVEAWTSAKTFDTVVAWADERREVAANVSNRPRKWRTSDVPYLREIMEACSFSHPAERVTVKKGNQVAVTEGVVMNMIGYVVDSWPGPVLVILPQDQDVLGYVKTRFFPAMSATPTVMSKLGEAETEGSGVQRESFVTFPGGQIFFQGSKALVREKPISVAILDDVDGAQRNPEGDIVALADKRLVTFRGRRKRIAISTPTLAGSSIIDREYKLGSQKRFHIPCPLCGAYAPLLWEHLVWRSESLADVRVRCPHCAGEWTEDRKLEACKAGVWVAERPEQEGRHESFLLPAFYSPFRLWSEIVEDFLEATKELRQDNNTAKLQVHMNCDRGEVFVPPEQVRLRGVELEVFQRREQPYDRRALPIEVVTVGADVQANRLEATAWGWGQGLECWFLEHVVIKGSPEDSATWNDLAAFALRHEARGLAVDGSAYTQTVKDQVDRLLLPLLAERCAIWAVKGQSGRGSIWPRAVRPGELVVVHIDAAKDQLYGALERIDSPGPGYIHLTVDLDQAWFNQLFSERPAVLSDRTKARYVKMDGRRRNEALDCAVYARAALYGLIALDASIARLLQSPAARETAPAPAHRPTPRGRARRRPSWVRR